MVNKLLFQIPFICISLFTSSSALALKANDVLKTPHDVFLNSEYPVNDISMEITDDLCPSSCFIYPCVCSMNSDTGKPDIDCSAVRSQLQLHVIFNYVDFPTQSLGEFKIHDNFRLKQLSFNVFGDITFDVIDIANTNLTYIDQSFFDNFHDTLKYIFVDFCSNLNMHTFPYAKISELKVLTIIRLRVDNLDFFPEIYSSSLLEIVLGSNHYIPSIPSDLYQRTPNLINFRMYGNDITTVEPNMFLDFPILREVWVNDNQIHEIPSLAFNFGGPNIKSIYLQGNGIYSIQPDSIRGLSNGYIYLARNELNTIDDSVFRSLLEKNNQVYITDNPIVCDCNIAWVRNDPTFFALISEGDPTCDNGVLLADLDLTAC